MLVSTSVKTCMESTLVQLASHTPRMRRVLEHKTTGVVRELRTAVGLFESGCGVTVLLLSAACILALDGAGATPAATCQSVNACTKTLRHLGSECMGIAVTASCA